jgi:hypothetical protein
MGELYRATDTKLRRDVAIKVLPDAPDLLDTSLLPARWQLAYEGTR